MSTPVRKPTNQSSILDYAPRHVREGGGPRRFDEDASPPRRADEEPRDDPRPDDEPYDIPLAPEAPRDEISAAAYRDRDEPASAPQRRPEETSLDEDIAQIAALLSSIRRGNAPDEQPAAAPPRYADALPPRDQEPEPEPEPDPDVYIDGLRLPRSLQPSFMPPPPLSAPASYLRIIGGVTAACAVAAALAFVMIGDWHSPAHSAAAPSAPTPPHRSAAAITDQSVAREAERGPRLASTPAPYTVASAAPDLDAPPAAAPRHAELSVAPSAPRIVPVVRVAPASAETQGNAAPSAPPITPPLLTNPARSPSPPHPQTTMDEQQVKLLLEQGKQFMSVGDLVTARTVLQRVADADIAGGAFALAETYDPAVIAKLGVRGMQGDIDQARRWYERAHELGSNEATSRLALMAHP